MEISIFFEKQRINESLFSFFSRSYIAEDDYGFMDAVRFIEHLYSESPRRKLDYSMNEN